MPKFRILLLTLVLVFELTQAVLVDRSENSAKKSSEKDRRGKIFSLFSIVTFENSGCRSSSNLNGTCFTSSECTNKGGQALGNCAAGFGVCCVFTLTGTSGTVTQNCTYIQNPGYPSVYSSTSSVSYTVNKCTSDVCWLRLDFESFTLLGPTDSLVNTPPGPVTGANSEILGGSCADTFKVVSTSGQTIPTICGQNTGQHMYIDVGSTASDTATLSFAFSGTVSSSSRKWSVKVTQVRCSSQTAPPNGCLQYQYARTGRITTYNFADPNGQHLANQQYNVCIRPEDGVCCVQYQVCQDQSNAFSLSGGGTKNTQSVLDENCPVPSIATLLSLDYIEIIGSSSCTMQGSGTNLHTRYCGGVFTTDTTALAINIPICDCAPPFRIGIYTNAISDVLAIAGIAPLLPTGVSNTFQSRGTCLDYTQIPCGAS